MKNLDTGFNDLMRKIEEKKLELIVDYEKYAYMFINNIANTRRRNRDFTWSRATSNYSQNKYLTSREFSLNLLISWIKALTRLY